MAVRENQITQLQKVQKTVAAVRNERRIKASEIEEDLQTIVLALSGLDNNLRNLSLQKEDARKAAKYLSGAYLGSEAAMPASVSDHLGEFQKKIEQLDLEIDQLKKSQSELTRRRDNASADLRIAQEDLSVTESELLEVEKKITELRGF